MRIVGACWRGQRAEAKQECMHPASSIEVETRTPGEDCREGLGMPAWEMKQARRGPEVEEEVVLVVGIRVRNPSERPTHPWVLESLSIQVVNHVREICVLGNFAWCHV